MHWSMIMKFKSGLCCDNGYYKTIQVLLNCFACYEKSDWSKKVITIFIISILWKYFSSWVLIFVVWLKITSSWILCLYQNKICWFYIFNISFTAGFQNFEKASIHSTNNPHNYVIGCGTWILMCLFSPRKLIPMKKSTFTVLIWWKW
jgi:hypothetical protein